jgi:hypothetical protein
MAKRDLKEKLPSVKKLDELYEDYDRARTVANDAEKDKAEASKAIKDLLGETQEASTPRYIVTYKYDADKDVESFDEEKFQDKDPKGYALYQGYLEEIKRVCKKYTKITTVKGARKLLVTAKEE